MSERFALALAHLEQGGVVAAATESLFGLLADATRSDAVARLVALKPRVDKGVPLILPNRESWSSVAEPIPALACALADAFWPGPLTLAVRARAALDPCLVQDANVAVRLPPPSPAARLAAALGRPLTATSANRTGEAPTADASAVRSSFAPEVANGSLFVLDDTAPGGPPSTVVVVDQEGFRVVREGAVSAAAIAACVSSARGGEQMG
ncbi:MAG: Sua5/YciO/YrdC/YwlC family protein [Myxococcales bacterium]|nr:Sua5/YciO/YrdC/YwlC family protein [Myxococcales bacterium]